MSSLKFSYGYTQTERLPGPEAFIRLYNPSDSSKSTSLVGIVDSGAEMTCIPISKIKSLGDLSYSLIEVNDANGNSFERKTYFVDISLEDQFFRQIEVIALPKNYALIGRDILNQDKIMLNANRDLWIYACPETCPLEEESS